MKVTHPNPSQVTQVQGLRYPRRPGGTPGTATRPPALRVVIGGLGVPRILVTLARD
ncbi:hypothetical protein SBA2_360034 [Acidobacteriia bacterium SbA2]|nr:hypothetical protein SBA2_360034 [Acidobacteriia bacterium SbA2]